MPITLKLGLSMLVLWAVEFFHRVKVPEAVEFPAAMFSPFHVL
jgi:hypothetical protein